MRPALLAALLGTCLVISPTAWAAPDEGLAAEPSQAKASEWSLDMTLGGGSALSLTRPMTTGHTVWGGVWLNWADFAVGVVAFGAYPGSRVQTRFGGILLDFRWYPLGAGGLLRPFVALGAGVASGDSLNGRTNIAAPVRWASEGPSLLFAPALGLRFGAAHGLFIVGEARLINAGHLALNLGAGVSF